MNYFEDSEDYDMVTIKDETFAGIDRRDVSFEKSKFININLTGTILEKFTIIDSELQRSNLSNLNCEDAYVKKVKFDGCRGTGLILNESEIDEIEFINCKLNLAQFRYAKIKKAKFTNCDLQQADFSGSEITKAEFKDCNLDQSLFLNSKLKEINLQGSRVNGISINPDQFSNLTINASQLIYFANLLGITIKD